ncbi:C10 family peptidase, partial [candidate division KSB1 bacterium]|nr:C10 family peptidase [candidate division KSB1 bacterium]
MMKRTYVIMISLFLAFQIFARTVNQADARKAALAWMKMVPEFKKSMYLPRTGVLTIKNEGQDTTLTYALLLQPRGYILVTPENDLHPILGFSFDSEFDATESEENLMLLLIRLDVPQRLQATHRGRLDPGYRSRSNELWQQLLQDSGTSLQKTPAQLSWLVETGPFLTCQWGQGSDAYGNYVFNYYTPSHYVCGCVATALSQILYYYRWPLTGTDDYSYLWGTTPLSADFGATTYDWAHMVDYYGSPAQPEINRQAAGLLAYHTGISVDMNYASGGSGAVTAKVATSCENYFRCNGEWVRGDASDFWSRLYNNMILEQPAELSIRTQKPPSSGVGHAIVVDGVRHEATGPQYYHLNFGWWGSNDSWYDISGNFSAGGYTWRYKEGAVLDILPLPDLTDPGTRLYTPNFTLYWDNGPVFSPDYYELQQAQISPSLSTFSDDAESGIGNWIVHGYWKNVGNQYHSLSHSFKGYIAEESGKERLFSVMELNKALKIDATTQISYYWGAYYFHYCEARLEISTDEKNWTPLRTHTSTATAYPITWYAVTIPPTEL